MTRGQQPTRLAAADTLRKWQFRSGPLWMSALGQKQTFEIASVMSALPPKADIGLRGRNVR